MVDTSVTKSYPYKPKKWMMMLCFIICGLLSWLSAERALTDDRGLTLILIRHVMEFSFSPFEATLFHWGLSIFCGVISLLCLFGLYRAFTSKAQIILTNKEISIPLGIFKPNKSVTIPFNEILSLEVHKVHRIRFLKIIHQKGATDVSESLLPKKIMLDEIIDSLTTKSESDQ